MKIKGYEFYPNIPGQMESPINSGEQFTMLPKIIHEGLYQEKIRKRIWSP